MADSSSAAHESSMRHQYRHRHRAENATRRAAPNELAQARMAIAAHHDEVGRTVRRMRKNRTRIVTSGSDVASTILSHAADRIVLATSLPLVTMRLISTL